MQAERHSRLVRRLRVALPALGLGLAGLMVAIGIVSRIELNLKIGELKISSEGLVMDAPRLSGSDGKGRIYEVTAARAIQDLSNPRLIKLYEIRATVTQADGQRADFAAANGLYDAGMQKLSLGEKISIRSSDGSAANLQHADIDLETGEVHSDAPVAFSSSLGSIEASGMEVGERGSSVTFTDGVKMTVDPNAVKNQSLPGKPKQERLTSQ